MLTILNDSTISQVYEKRTMTSREMKTVCAQLFMLHHIQSKELLLRYYSRNFTNRITNEGKKKIIIKCISNMLDYEPLQ